MFDIIIREVASRFGLGDKAAPLVQMLLAFITNKDSGGIAGFMSKLTSSGLGDVAQSWLGGGDGAKSMDNSQVQSLLGGHGGLIESISSKLGIDGGTAASAMGFLLPMVIGKLTPGGKVPTSLSGDILGFITGGASALADGVSGAAGAAGHAVGGVASQVGGMAQAGAGAAAVAAVKASTSAAHAVSGAAGAVGGAVSGAANAGVNAVAATGGGLMKWLPWVGAGIAALFLLSYCGKKDETAKVAADAPAPAVVPAPAAPAEPAPAAPAVADATTTAPANAAAPAVAPAEQASAVPADGGLVAYEANGMPALKVYFASGKTDVVGDFAAGGAEVLDFLKANGDAKAVVTGYNDPRGNAAANAELSKNRAKNVAAALAAAGVVGDRVVLEKPASPTEGADQSNAEARRVEVTIRK